MYNFLQEVTNRLIFAYGYTDPINDDYIDYHGPGQRGTKSEILLSSVSTRSDFKGPVKYLDFTNQNVSSFSSFSLTRPFNCLDAFFKSLSSPFWCSLDKFKPYN